MIPQFQKITQLLDYTDHAWLEDDRIVAGTQSGELLMLENFELKQHIESAFNTGGLGVGMMGEDGQQQAAMNVSLIKPYSKGFFISSDNGYMALWVRHEENNSTSGK